MFYSAPTATSDWEAPYEEASSSTGAPPEGRVPNRAVCAGLACWAVCVAVCVAELALMAYVALMYILSTPSEVICRGSCHSNILNGATSKTAIYGTTRVKTLFVRPAECELSAAPALSAAMAALG